MTFQLLNYTNWVCSEYAGTTGQEAFIITENDEVFACGLNYSGCLGLGKQGPQIEPMRVPELCHKNVKGKLVESSYFVKPFNGIFENTLCIRSRNRMNSAYWA